MDGTRWDAVEMTVAVMAPSWGFMSFKCISLKKNSTDKNNSTFVLSNANSAQRDREV